MHLRDLANVNTNKMIICGGRIDGATTAAQASCDSCATPSCMGATEPPVWGDFRSPIKCPELAEAV